MKLSIELFDGFRLKREGKMITGFRSRKTEAIFAYLTMQPNPVTRSELAGIFWYDSEPEQASANLRKTLHDLRRRVGEWLLVTRHTIAFNRQQDYWLDAQAMLEGITAVSTNDGSLSAQQSQMLAEALSYYKGDFLAGLHVQGAPLFEEWAAMERERFRLQAARHLQRLVTFYLHYGRYQEGIMQAQRLTALDSFNEQSHRLLMRPLARSGQRNAALLQYDACRQILQAELGVEPAAETTALFQRILAARSEPPFRVPLRHTSFVGYGDTLARLSHLVDDPDARLITLAGMGGAAAAGGFSARHLFRAVDGRFRP